MLMFTQQVKHLNLIKNNFCSKLSFFFLNNFTAKESGQHESDAENERPDMGRLGFDVSSIWNSGTSHLVGILLGHYGAGHILCDVRNCDGRLCVLLSHETGLLSFT